MAFALYLWLVIVGGVDLFLVAPALRRARYGETVGRLVSTLATLSGLVLVGAGRIVQHSLDTPGSVVAGVILADVGLAGYALFLPERGLLHLARRAWKRAWFT